MAKLAEKREKQTIGGSLKLKRKYKNKGKIEEPRVLDRALNESPL